MKLDMNAETPLYMQLKEAIKAAIKDGTYPDNEKIPTEIELSEHYKVSRITVRRAVEELCQENYLVKRQGKGTFVKSNAKWNIFLALLMHVKQMDVFHPAL